MESRQRTIFITFLFWPTSAMIRWSWKNTYLQRKEMLPDHKKLDCRPSAFPSKDAPNNRDWTPTMNQVRPRGIG